MTAILDRSSFSVSRRSEGGLDESAMRSVSLWKLVDGQPPLIAGFSLAGEQSRRPHPRVGGSTHHIFESEVWRSAMAIALHQLA
jgi:hypothetical protein